MSDYHPPGSNWGREDFLAWKTRRTRSTSELRTRGPASGADSDDDNDDDDDDYDEQTDIVSSIHAMCDRISGAISGCNIDTTTTNALMRAIQSARATPTRKTITVAVTGNQGIGKSSLLISLLGKPVVNVSAGSKAETTVPTIIAWKEEASDSTTQNNMIVEFQDDKTNRKSGREHPRDFMAHKCPSGIYANTSNTEHGAVVSASEDRGLLGTRRYDDEERYQRFQHDLRDGYNTAMEYFNVVFATQDNPRARKKLESRMECLHTEGDAAFQGFLDDVVDMCHARVKDFQSRHRSWALISDGSLKKVNIDNEAIRGETRSVLKLWPLIETITVLTGSELLRKGLRFVDLPGNGDSNLIRTASLNKYQRAADFEIVVAWSQRYETEKVQDSYLGRANHQHGQGNTILVFNQIDLHARTIDDYQVTDIINRYPDEPFPQLKACLTYARGRSQSIDSTLLLEYEDDINNRARMTYIKHQIEEIGLKLDESDSRVRMFAVSASQFNNRMVRRDQHHRSAYVDLDQTGIPELRDFLSDLATNAFRADLLGHVQEELNEFEDEIERLLEKFKYNEDFAKMCNVLTQDTPTLQIQLNSLAINEPRNFSSKPWDINHESHLKTSFRSVIGEWKGPNVMQATFNKMLSTNGIVDGKSKARGRNLNNEFLRMYRSYLDNWKYAMLAQTKLLCECLCKPLLDHLQEIDTAFEDMDEDVEDSDLLEKAGAEIKKLSDRVNQAYGETEMKLKASTLAVYRCYTTETDISCPVAVMMRPRYLFVWRTGDRGPGVHARQRSELTRQTNNPGGLTRPLPEAICNEVSSDLVQRWIHDCKLFVAKLMKLVTVLPRNLKTLLEDTAYNTQAHRLLRKGLAKQLPRFSAELEQLRRKLSVSDEEEQG